MNRNDDSWALTRRLLLGIIVASVLLRLASAVYLGNTVDVLPGTFDQVSYHKLALRLLDGHGFSFGEEWWPATRANEPTAHWSYLYTLFLAAVYAISGSSPLIARIVQGTIVGISMPWLVYRITYRLFAANWRTSAAIDERDRKRAGAIALVAAAIIAVYVYFVYYAAALMTESFYITAILWTIDGAMIIAQSNEHNLRRWGLLGLAMGTAVLLRQVFLLVIPFVLVWLWWSARPRLRMLAIPLLVTFLMMLPWMVRNYLAFDQFVLLNTNSGYAFFWGNHPIYGTDFVPILTDEMGSYQSLIPPELLHLNEAAMDSALLKIAVENVLADPGRYILLSISRIRDYFTFWPMSDSGTLSNISRVASFGLFLPFMVAGLVQTGRSRFPDLGARVASPLFFLYLFILVYTGIHVLTWTLIRYRLPVDAVLVIFAAVAVVRTWEWIRRQRRPG